MVKMVSRNTKKTELTGAKQIDKQKRRLRVATSLKENLQRRKKQARLRQIKSAKSPRS
tara:strand:- start:208 stop:381 length:174 start_codon:yes stop_codon:yes gene_type:complete